MNTTEQEVEKGKEEIATKVKIPKEVNKKIYSKLAKEFWIASAIFIYFLFLNFGYNFLNEAGFQRVLNIFSGILICSTVIMFEVAYRKDSNILAVHGVELFGLSVITLFMPYIYFHRSIALRFLYSFSSMYIAIYYSIKALIIYTIETKKYLKSLSDVKEIIVDEPTSYLDEVNERKFEEERRAEEELSVKIEDQIELNKKNKKKFEFIKKKLDKIREDKSKLEEKQEQKENKTEEHLEKEKVEETKVKEKQEEKNLEEVCENEENKEESQEGTEESKKKKTRRKRKKKEVKSMATAKNKNKENGEE